MIEKLRKKHNVLCTSRSYDEVSKLAKIRNFDLVCVGKHGGSKKYSKLEASTNRIKKLSLLIDKFSPELAISFCSPEAARVSFGMGIRHIAFCDSPHASAVMKLTLPLIQKLLIPWIIPKKEFSKYGIDTKNIIPYKAIDAYVTIKRNVNQKDSLPFKNNNRKNILIRVEEEQAAYTQKSRKIIPIIKEIIDEFDQENIVILGRYSEQIKNLRKLFGKKAKILKMSYDGKYLLDHTDVFLGSGGTMTAESALLGVPTISYNAVPNIVEKYLVKNNLVKRETDPKKINKIIKKFLESADDNYRKRARKISNSMEDPIRKVVQIIRK
jgi:predicted glycosyltransferase